jgi:HD-GYP domain-containing protein (c-di-GMP phosphodiesterase class II)/HAMP domain-containing protein
MPDTKRPPFPIGLRFAALISGLLVITVVLFGGAAHWEMRRSALESASQRLRAVTRETARMLDGSAATLRSQLVVLTKRPLVQEAFRAPDGDSARALLVAASRQTGASLGIQLFDAAGRVVMAAGPRLPALTDTERTDLIGLIGDSALVATGNIRLIDDSVAYPTIARVSDSVQTLGYLVQWRRLVSSDAGRQQLTGLIGSSARLSIGNKRGDLWTDLVTRGDAPPTTIGDDLSVVHEQKRPDGNYLAVAVPLGTTPWILLVEFPHVTILSHLPATLARLGLVAVVLLVLGIATAWRMSRSVTQPIAELSEATSALRSGDFSKRVRIQRHDELGELSQLFNEMAAAVSAGNERIETQLGRLKALRTIDLAILGTTDKQLLLQSVLGQVMSQLRADAAAIFLYNPHTLTVDTSASIGYRTRRAERERVRLGDGVAGKAAHERRTVSVPDLSKVDMSGGLRSVADEEGFQSVYAVPLIAKGQVIGVLDVFFRTPFTASDDWLGFCEALAGQAAMAIESSKSFEDLQRSNVELSLAYDTTIEGWSRALDMRDRETEGHSQRVTEMTLRLARLAGMSDDAMVHVRRGALLHDIGKMAIPDTILHKAGPLNDEEWKIMREHPTHALRLLQPIAYLRPALEIPHCHHERWDGKGYPQGLKGQAIPMAARLFSVVDVWDALSNQRPYRAAWPEHQVHDFLREHSGSAFDPAAVELFFRAISEGPELVAVGAESDNADDDSRDL